MSIIVYLILSFILWDIAWMADIGEANNLERLLIFGTFIFPVLLDVSFVIDRVKG